jgi:hypothetical protein
LTRTTNIIRPRERRCAFLGMEGGLDKTWRPRSGMQYKSAERTHSEEKSLVLILMIFAKERLKVSAGRCVSVYTVGMLYLHGEGDKERNENEQHTDYYRG